MVARGYRLVLDPERYPEHEALAKRLIKTGGWAANGWNPDGTTPEPTKTDGSVGLLPHQAEAVQQIRKNLG